MIYIAALVQSLLTSVGMILSQKILEKRTIGNNWQTAITRSMQLGVIGLFIIFGVSSVSLDPFFLAPERIGVLFILGLALLYVTYPLRRIAYLNEKISALQPFALAKQLFGVIGSIIILQENVSTITLVATLLAMVVLIGASIENGKIVINKYSLLLLLSSFIQSIQLIVVMGVIQTLGAVGFYFFESIGILIIALGGIFIKHEWREIRLATKKYVQLQVLGNGVSLVAILISLMLYKSVGVVVTSLFGLFSLVFTLVLSFVFLLDIPKRKDLLVTGIIALFVCVGSIFRQ